MTPPGAWSTPLQKSFNSFPSGSVGGALLVLRSFVAVVALTEAVQALTLDQCALCLAAAIPAALFALALLPGFMTPIASALLASQGAAILFGMNGVALHWLDSRMALLQFVVMAATLAVVGPGAASIDALLFGRREIAIRRRGNEP